MRPGKLKYPTDEEERHYQLGHSDGFKFGLACGLVVAGIVFAVLFQW